LEKNSRALQLAETGLAIGLHPLIQRNDPLLTGNIGHGEGYQVKLRSEGGRLNINSLIRNQRWQILQNLFLVWKMNQIDAATVTKAIEEWTQPGLLNTGSSPTAMPVLQPAVSGTGTPPTANTAPQIVRFFESVEQMLQVPEMKLVVRVKPDWQNYFTVWSSGQLDMNEAPADLISAVCGVSTVQAQRLVKARLGPDGIPDTDDDVIFQSMDQVRGLLGISPDVFESIQNQLSLQDSVVRLESTGTLDAYQRKISVVALRSNGQPVFFQWREF
jgi:type II secretory pathway component PulK